MITRPAHQRELRAHRPLRPPRRVINSAEHQAWLASHLTTRDRWLVHMLYEHKVLTTHHMVALAFPSPRAASLRLAQLYQWGVVHRFQPHRHRGSYPLHYVLDSAGATLLAHEHGINPHDLGYRREREIGRAHSLQLAHTTGCHTVFTTLIQQARHSEGAQTLLAWWSPHRCAQYWGDLVRPDGYGRWRDDTREVEWCFEWDTGTERLARLGHKLAGYERLATHTGLVTPVLLWLPSARREAGARRALTDALRSLDHPERVPVATTATDLAGDDHLLDATVTRWLPITRPANTRRMRLIDLAHHWPPTPTAQPTTTDTDITLPDRAEVPPPAPMPPPLPPYRTQP